MTSKQNVLVELATLATTIIMLVSGVLLESSLGFVLFVLGVVFSAALLVDLYMLWDEDREDTDE